jgi:hypothetical protein
MPVSGYLPFTVHDADGNEVKLQGRLIKSSNIDWIGWPVTGEPMLVVQFKGGGRYAYLGVSRQRSVALAHHASSGKYINERIKPHFEVVKLR